MIAHENTKLRLTQSHELLGMRFEPAPPTELPTQTFAAGLSVNANGERLADVQAAKPTADLDATWGKGFMQPADFLALVYNTTR